MSARKKAKEKDYLKDYLDDYEQGHHYDDYDDESHERDYCNDHDDHDDGYAEQIRAIVTRTTAGSVERAIAARIVDRPPGRTPAMVTMTHYARIGVWVYSCLRGGSSTCTG